jgi:antitoxin protein of toxin-antitoxin system
MTATVLWRVTAVDLERRGMGIADKLKDLKTKAVDATVEHNDKIHGAVEKAAATADERTGGKYHDRIQKAGAKASSIVDGFAGSEQPQNVPPDAPDSPPAASPL